MFSQNEAIYLKNTTGDDIQGLQISRIKEDRSVSNFGQFKCVSSSAWCRVAHLDTKKKKKKE